MVKQWGLVFGAILLSLPMARAGDEAAVVDSATRLLEEISSNPKSGIPAKFLQEARGILIMPHVVENQLVVGHKKQRPDNELKSL